MGCPEVNNPLGNVPSVSRYAASEVPLWMVDQTPEEASYAGNGVCIVERMAQLGIKSKSSAVVELVRIVCGCRIDKLARAIGPGAEIRSTEEEETHSMQGRA
jgi:hypothetical protein